MRCLASIAVVTLLVSDMPAWGWWGQGHTLLTQAALRCLDDDAPAFLRMGEETVAHVVWDPDLFKNRAAPHLYDVEHGEHYLDLELLRGHQLPTTRYAFYDTCAALGIAPSQVGTLPYAIAEWTERLQIALAEHRRWPENAAIRSKCLIYAGVLAHYAQDACQPLHVTVDFDGRKRADGTREAAGIHAHMDALVERLNPAPADLEVGVEVRVFGDLMAAIVAEIDRSHACVDTVYDLAAVLDDPSCAAVRALGLERARAAVAFTASLYRTAWRGSAQVMLPEWDRR